MTALQVTRLLPVLGLLGLVAIACGSDDRVTAPGDETPTPVSTPAPTTTPAPIRPPPQEPSPPDQFGNWVTVDGEPVLATTIVSFSGPEHCGWEDTTMMFLALPVGSVANTVTYAGQYIKDDLGVLIHWNRDELDDYKADAQLPADAVFSGYVNDGIEMWFVEAELDSGIFMVEGESVEKWPRIDPIIMCD